MSEETPIQQQESEKPSQSYISRVRLKGYKSILDTEVTFKPGLNIIIGANGSGKTNFVEFLKTVNSSLDKIEEFYYKVEIINADGDLIEWEFTKNVSIKESSKSYKPTYLYSGYVLNKKNGKEIFSEKYDSENGLGLLFFADRLTKKFEGFLYNEDITYLKFNIPTDYSKLTQPLEITFETDSKIPGFFVNPSVSNENSFLGYVVNFFFLVFQDFKDKLKEEKESLIREKIESKFNIFKSNIEYNLNKFSPIKKIRINPEFRVLVENNEIRAYNVNIQFFVNDNWFPWNNLSDGTKRIFYVITESILCEKLLLLEEPELGIHPHQLIRLMDFIKEQSATKQIIITTHSPEVLNTLKMDELDRIIVARYDKDKGTQMSHLSEDDIAHARSYMKDELFLSDYWVMSGFETEEEAV